MDKHQVTFWTDELIYTKSALIETIERYRKHREEAIQKFGPDCGHVYTVAIQSMGAALETLEKVLPEKEKTQ